MKMKKLVHIIEDEEDIGRLIKYNLSLEGYQVSHFVTGEDGLRAVCREFPELILLDLMLPGIDGLEICRKLKSDERTSVIPIIMVTAKGEEEDIVKGLEIGADDYITKPFSPKVLMARVNAAFRRQNIKIKGKDDVIRVHELTIHPMKYEVILSGCKVELTPSEFQILHTVARKQGWVFTRSQIVDAIRSSN